jgi:predicted transcriptional regulator of viral defense system
MASAKAPTHEAVALRLLRKGGLIHTRDLAAAGVPTVVLTRLVRDGAIDRIGRGLYAMPGETGSAHRSLAEVALRVPKGVVCLLSALRVHEIGTQSPFEVWLALPKGTVAPRLPFPALRVIRVSGDAFTEGVAHRTIDGVDVQVYDAAKTIADCFKFRNKIGLDVAIEALREAWRERKVTPDALWHYAKVDRVANVMRPYLEALA